LRALVTGAGGFIGSRLVKKIANQKNMEVKAIVRPGSDISRLNGLEDKILYGDLNNKKAVDEMLENVDCIYHLAAGTAGSHFEMMMNTVVATDNILSSMIRHRINRFVLVSSFSVYQMTALKRGAVLDETCPIESNLKDRDPYTITKVRQENLVRKKCKEMNIPLVTIRPGKIYGPGDHPIPPQLGITIPAICFLYIGGNNIIPLTHVQNCADAIYLAGVTDGIAGEVFNIVDNNLPTQKIFMQWYESVLGKLHKKIWLPYTLFELFAIFFEFSSKKTKGNIPPIITRYRGENLWKDLHYDNSKARLKLGWIPKIGVEEGVQEMFKDIAANT